MDGSLNYLKSQILSPASWFSYAAGFIMIINQSNNDNTFIFETNGLFIPQEESHTLSRAEYTVDWN